MRIYFIDVGFGDSTLIISDGHALLFDAGGELGAQKVLSALSDAGVEKLDVLALSSNSTEHIAGARQISIYHLIGQVWHNGVNYSDAAYSAALSIAGAPSRSVEYGDTFEFGNGKITILNPQKERYLSSPGPDSIAMKAEYGDFCALLFSDSEGAGASSSDAGTVVGGIESKIISSPIPLSCQIIKVGNHGSGNAASFQLLDVASPQIAVISVGANPGAKYPDSSLLERLKLKGISTLRTDEVGTVSIYSSGSGYKIYSEK